MHTLTISRPKDVVLDEGDEWEDDDWEFDIECDRTDCQLWSECPSNDHQLDLDDMYEHNVSDPYVEHGVPHVYLSELGWCEPAPGCAYTEIAMDWGDSHWYIAQEHGAGRYAVSLEWDDSTSASILMEERLEDRNA